MPVGVAIEYPDDNDIDLDPFFLETGTGFVSVKGRGNSVRVGRPAAAGAAQVVVENGARVSVGEGCILSGVGIHALAAGASIEVGAGTGFNGIVHLTAHEPAAIRVGRDCLFGPDTSLTASDVHRIYDVRKSVRLNPAGDIILGDRVWLAARAVVFRQSTIGHDSVVGWASIVKGRFPDHCLIAGAPARVVRKGIRWER